MLLKNLIKNLSPEKKKIRIRGLHYNSKKIKKGFIFFAIKGNKINGEKFINEAVKKGASVVVCSHNCRYKNKNTYVIKTYDVRNYLSKISSKFYNYKPKNIIAVTGTNGKTSVADLFYQILRLNNVPVASIGTLGIKYNGKKEKSDLTSPSAIELHRVLEKIKKKGIDNVIIETSSHGIHQKRVNHINFKAGIFTNFSQDHLDYHKTMRSYLNIKLKLFKDIISPKKTLISDKSIKEFQILEKISKKKQFRLIEINLIKKKLSKIKDLGFNEFQLKNLSMAFAAAKICKLKEKRILASITKIKDVDGRLQLVKTFSNNIKTYVDFAHTPDALKKSIIALKKFHGDNISLVFGCGGERDQKKRPLMAKIASSNCKKIYITDDNPRNEKPEKIRKEILKNIKNINCFNIGDRSKAIELAINNAEPNEVILIAGKGHETQQIYKKKILYRSDKEIIFRIKLKAKKLSNSDLNFLQNKKIISEIKKGLKVENFHGISIDTRSLKKNNLFLTIKGKNNDGSIFIPQALKKGAKYIVSSKNIRKYKNKTIKVNDEKNFLKNFASKKRKYTKAKIFAITGSSGKTSLKNILKDLLQNFGETLSSPKSFNNQLGVPISLSQLQIKHKFGIFEIGMSKAGEINKLSKLVSPEIGVITNIGEAHIENFKNVRGIADSKSELIDNIKKGGTIILNYDDKYFSYLAKKARLKKLKIVSFGLNKKADISPISQNKNKNKTFLKIKVIDEILKFDVKSINIYNVLSSLALLKSLNLDLSKITNYFKYYIPT